MPVRIKMKLKDFFEIKLIYYQICRKIIMFYVHVLIRGGYNGEQELL